MQFDMNTLITPDMQAALEKSQELAGSDYKMRLSVELTDTRDKISIYTSADEKCLAFYDACRKQGVVGRIEADKIGFQQIGNGYWLVFATVYVYMDNVLKGSATASQAFTDQGMDIDRSTQIASGLAKSKALANAGFGICNFYVPVPQVGPNPGESENVPFFFGSEPPAPDFAHADPQTVFSAAGSPTGPAPGAGNDLRPSAASPGSPVELAKTVPYPPKGITFGQMLETDPNFLRSGVEQSKFRGKSLDAARLLYPEACRRCGVAANPKFL